MTSAPRPPRWAARLVALTLRRPLRGPVLGDLEERFSRRVREHGRRAASLWYLRQAWSFVVHAPASRIAGASARVPAGLVAIVRDAGFAARSLVARPGFALPVIAIFALAIAANSLVFSLVDAVLLRHLPYPDPDSLVLLWDRSTEGGPGPVRDVPITRRHFDVWRERSDLFSAIGAFDSGNSVVQWEGGTAESNSQRITAGLLEALGARPLHGRLLQLEDEAPGAPPVVVLSHRTWSVQFGQDPGVIGRDMVVDGRPTRIVGVLPHDFWFYDPYMYFRSVGSRDAADPTFWLPLESTPEDWYDYPMLRVLARLRPELALPRVGEEVATQRGDLTATDDRPGFTTAVVPLREHMIGPVRGDLGLLAGAVVMVFLVACANVFSLLMSRSSARRQELWIRRALGAGDWAITRVVVAESVWLAVSGGVLGLVLTESLNGFVVEMTPRDMPLVYRAGVDVRVAGFTLGLALAGGLLAGLLQARRLLRDRAADGAMSAAERTVTGRGGAVRFFLTAAQVAVSMALLVGAATAAAAFVGLRDRDPGFRAEGVLTFETSTARFQEGSERFFDDLMERIRMMPGVESVAGNLAMPLSRWAGGWRQVRPLGAESAEPVDVGYRHVTTGFFETLEIPLVSGRTLAETDRAGGTPVILLSAAAARALFPTGDAVGGAVAVRAGNNPAEVREVVGVVGDVVHRRLGEEPAPVLYVPMSQADFTTHLHIAVRTARARPLELVSAIRTAARELDPRHPVSYFNDLEQLLVATVAEQSFFARLLGIFGGMALLLACAGLYGTVGYHARLRMPEMGVRKAFGAQPANLRRLLLLQGMRPVVVGLLLGVPGALGLDRVLAANVAGVSGTDPIRLSAVAAAFVVAAVVAGAAPAVRVGAVDPVRALREGG